MNSVTQRSPEPMIRRTVKRLALGWAAREAWMLCRPLRRSPDWGYSSTASSRYIACSASKSFASPAAQWRSSASLMAVSSMAAAPVADTPHMGGPGHVARAGWRLRALSCRFDHRPGGLQHVERLVLDRDIVLVGGFVGCLGFRKATFCVGFVDLGQRDRGVGQHRAAFRCHFGKAAVDEQAVGDAV